MLRRLFVIFSIFGFLLCPYRCMGLGEGCCTANAQEKMSQCGTCCDYEKPSEIPCRDGSQPVNDDGQHECLLAKSTVPLIQKSPEEIVRSMVDFAGLAMSGTPERFDVAFIESLLHRAPALPGMEEASGIGLRLTIASLLI